MADSGAILTTLAPFPLQSDLIPPSLIIMEKPEEIPILFWLDACTWNKTKFSHFNNLSATIWLIVIVKKWESTKHSLIGPSLPI